MADPSLEQAESQHSPKKSFLITGEISDIRINTELGGLKGKKYQNSNEEVTLIPLGMDPGKVTKEDEEELRALWQVRESGEIYPYERLLVSALLQQSEIAKKFGIDKNSLFTSLKIEMLLKGTTTFDND